MKTLAVVAQKGGCGKTTLSVHLAACAAKAGLAVALIDIDIQGNSLSWFKTRKKENELAATKARAEELPELLERLKKAKADLVIIDTAPHSDFDAAAAVELSDFVLIPCRPARFDLEAMPSTVNIVRLTKKTPPHAILINAAPQGNLALEAKAALEAQGFPVMEKPIFNRVAFNYAVTDGRSVQEYEPYGKAAREIESLYKEITNIMDI